MVVGESVGKKPQKPRHQPGKDTSTGTWNTATEVEGYHMLLCDHTNRTKVQVKMMIAISAPPLPPPHPSMFWTVTARTGHNNPMMDEFPTVFDTTTTCPSQHKTYPSGRDTRHRYGIPSYWVWG